MPQGITHCRGDRYADSSRALGWGSWCWHYFKWHTSTYACRCRSPRGSYGLYNLRDVSEPPAIASFNKLRAQVHDCNFGGDCYNYAVLASGFLDIVVETSLKPWDFAAIVPVILAAGGSITDWQGRPLLLSSAGDVVASSDSALHRQVLPFLK